MALIPAGSFTIGNTIGDSNITDAIPTNVMMLAFYMDVNLVSSNQFWMVAIWATSHGYGFYNFATSKAGNHPVQEGDWYDCLKWCNARSQQAGLTPVYYMDAGLTQVFTNGGYTNSLVGPIVCELGGQRISVGDGSGVGEGGTGRVERATVSLG